MLLKVDLVKLYFGDFPQEDREMTWYFEDQHPLSQDQLTREDYSPIIGAESSPAPIDSEEAIISEIESQEKKEEEKGVTIYCAKQAADSNGVMEEMPADVEVVEVTPSSDQGDTDNIGLEKFRVMDVSADLTCEEMIYLIHKAAKEPNVMKNFTGFISESSNSIFFHFESDSALNAFTEKFTDMDLKTFKEEANTAGRTKIIDDNNLKLIVVHEVPKKSKDLSRRDKGWNWDLLEQTCEFVIRRGGTKGSCHNQSQCVI